MEKKTQINFWYILLSFFVIIFIQKWWDASQQVETVPYSEFQTLLKDGKLAEIGIADQYIRGLLKSPQQNGPTQIYTLRVEADLARDLEKYNVRFAGIVESKWLSNLLSWVMPILVFVVLWIFVIRRMVDKQGMGGFMSIGKSKAKIYMEKETAVTFDDVAGVDEAKAELQEIVQFLKNPKHYGRLGARIPKGVLLIGPPGTGKTLLARAIAGQAGVPFFSISGSEFVEMFVGVGAARVRDLFEQARLSAPCIIFIDELDALGRARGLASQSGGGSDEKEQTLNQLLSEMDGFDASSGVVLLAATNRPEILDPALLRAGRFDRQVLVDRPDKKGREAILLVHLKKIQLAADVPEEQIAALTPGFTGADLENVVNEAAILATRRDGQSVTMADFTAAIERIVAGLEKKSRLINPHERHVVAHHELGHAFVALALPGADTVHKVSIIPRGISALGYTIQRPTEDRYLMTRPELTNKMAILLGGRAAEQLFFNEISTGAADDLDRASDIARNMVMRYGMDEKLGHVTYDDPQSSFLGDIPVGGPRVRRLSEETTRDIDRAVRKLIEGAFDQATEILKIHKALLAKTAELLLERETLTADELPKIKKIKPTEKPV
ncbi:MAG: ATP-dependent metallopeptidase FtsH/Yme1/Tma family protein [Rhodospirillales bacterium]|nr:ATP-dependent metallopeptidase FtsH/Yme1/Tma family protein [Rhodospirillales bacterium]